MADHQNETGGIEKLKDSETYQLWKYQLDIHIKSKGLYGILDGTTTEPAETASEKDKKEWMKSEATVLKCITQTSDKKVILHIMGCKSAKEAYEKLKTLFERDTDQQKCSLMEKLYNFQFSASESVSDNIAEIDNIAFRLRALGEEISESMIMARVLSVLPEEYKHFRTAWESTTKAEKTLENMVARLTTEETNLKAAEGNSEVAFKVKTNQSTSRQHAASGSGTKNVKCFACNEIGHIARYCKKNKNSCSICKKTNHNEKNCFYRKNKDENSRNVSFLSFLVGDNKNKGTGWIVDSGASTHMTNDRKVLENVNKKVTPFTVANDTVMTSKEVGNVKAENCNLNEVAFVPELLSNLLSVNRVTQNGGTVIFDKNEVVIKYEDQEVLKGEKNNNGLYTVNLKTGKNACYSVVDWHQKLGHLGLQNMKKLKEISNGMNFNHQDGDLKCEVCIKAKHVRTPFSGELPQATRVNEIIHTDVCAIDTYSYNNKRYFITLLDDYSHYCEVYVMSRKSESAQIVKDFVNRIENLHGQKVVTIKSDNGGEYIALKNWCLKKGIRQDFSAAYSPANNGKAERLNRTLCEKTRALLFDSKVDKQLWPEALQVAAYVTNRSPTVSRSVTPIELWTGKRPDLKNLRTFGSIAYAKKLRNVKKLDERSTKMIFVGYSTSGYRLWDGDKICISRDVTFLPPSGEKSIENDEKVVNLDLGDDFSENGDTVDDLLSENDSSRVESSSVQTPSSSDANTSVTESGGSPEDDVDWVNRLRPRGQLQQPDFENHITDLTNLTDYLDGNTVLLTFAEATSNRDKEEWLRAIDEEKKAITVNNTWKYVDRAEAKGRKILSSRWVFRIKDDGKYRARLCARGFEQVEGLDFTETYSPVVNFTALRTLCAIAAAKNFACKTFDVKTAFLNGTIDEDIYMEIPDGFEKKSGKVCKLLKSLYGLRQAPIRWNITFKQALHKLGLKSLKNDPCIFKNESNTIYLAIHVDDGILFGKNENELSTLLEGLKEFFQLTSGDTKIFLGITLKFENGIHMSQKMYALEILKRFHMLDCKAVDTPICKPNDSNEDENLCHEKLNFPYREAVGSLLYLSAKTRPDLSFAVGFESRSQENPSQSDVMNVKRTLRYLKGTTDKGILFKPNGDLNTLIVYSDSDYASDKSRKSTSGYVCFLNGAPIAWYSRRQSIISLSSTEAEFIAAAESVKEVLYLKSLLEELIGNVRVVLNVDNNSAICIIKNGTFNKRSKHIDVRFHFIHDVFERKLFEIQYCPSEQQVADILTKPLLSVKFNRLSPRLIV